MQDISKPRIVDFLRTCDKLNWVHPRIRFASVRSKPELIEDIEMNFTVGGEFYQHCPSEVVSSDSLHSVRFGVEAVSVGWGIPRVAEGVTPTSRVFDFPRGDDD